jgi:uncharacterized protein (TIGR02001 family)
VRAPVPSRPRRRGIRAASPTALASGLIVAAAALCGAAPAGAQVGASLTLQSDFRYRGRSISDEKPALTFNLAYDHESGVYLGGDVTAGDTATGGVRVLRHVAYAGYAVRPKTGPAFDVGVANYHVADFRAGKRTFDYNEVYAGLLGDRLSLRAHYAPDYYESGVKTLYVDLSGALRPRPDVRLFAHAGVLTRVGGTYNPGARYTRYDFSAGVAKQFGDCEISATWSRYDPSLDPARSRREKRSALVLAASYFF